MPIPNLATLTIERIIIHEVPHHLKKGAAPGPILSEVESALTGDLPHFFSERIKDTMAGPSAFDVVADPDSSSPVRDLVLELLNGSEEFVHHSQGMAGHLHQIQTGVNPGGLLVVIDCRLGKRTALAILKLEREEGVRLEQSKLGGKRTFNLGLIRDLIFTEKTKLFKIGLFLMDSQGHLQGMVCDKQVGYLQRTEVASFFLSDFLGCRLRADPPVSTKRFFEAGEDFINQVVTDPIDRTTYHTHLLSELTSNRSSVNPRQFANNYFKTKYRQGFLDHLTQNDVPDQPFPKNNSLIASRLKTTIMEFQSGIKVSGSQTAIKEKVSLKKTGEEIIQATITDKLKNVRGR